MQFNSVIFISAFLPIMLTGWYLLQKLKNPICSKFFLIGMSLWFYGYYNVACLLILLGSLAVNFLLGMAIGRNRDKSLGKAVLILGILVNVGSLFYFKYMNFFLENCNYFLHTNWEMEKLALPLGISFFTFQQIAYLVDRYEGAAEEYALIDYACFITFFPTVTSGPILNHREFIPQIQEKKVINAEKFFDGLSLFILGLGKKVLLADTLAVYVNAEYENIPYLDMPTAWLTIIFYMMQLYFDFSGYSDMARGVSKMCGFEVPENFDSPLMAVSVKDFWGRWHKTLTSFLTRYIYIPLGGNRRGKLIKCRNLLIVFLVSGLWHGANWTFVVWGLMHAAAMIFESLFPRCRFPKDWMNRLVTGLYVTLCFSVFRSESLSQAGGLFQKLFAGGWNGMILGMANVLQIPETYVLRNLISMKFPMLANPFYMACMLLVFGISLFFIIGKKAEEWIDSRGCTKRGVFAMAFMFVWSFISLSQVSTFIYFNF